MRLADLLYHLLTEWTDHGAESYRLAMPTREAIHAAGADPRSWCAQPVVRCTPIGWTVWAADRSRHIASGRETGPEARRLADEAATKAGWVLT